MLPVSATVDFVASVYRALYIVFNKKTTRTLMWRESWTGGRSNTWQSARVPTVGPKYVTSHARWSKILPLNSLGRVSY